MPERRIDDSGSTGAYQPGLDVVGPAELQALLDIPGGVTPEAVGSEPRVENPPMTNQAGAVQEGLDMEQIWASVIRESGNAGERGEPETVEQTPIDRSPEPVRGAVVEPVTDVTGEIPKVTKPGDRYMRVRLPGDRNPTISLRLSDRSGANSQSSHEPTPNIVQPSDRTPTDAPHIGAVFSGKGRKLQEWFVASPNAKRYAAIAAAAGLIVASIWGAQRLTGGGHNETIDALGQHGTSAGNSQADSAIRGQAAEKATARQVRQARQAAERLEARLYKYKGGYKLVEKSEVEGHLAQEVKFKGIWVPEGPYDNPPEFAPFVRRFGIHIDGEFAAVTTANPGTFSVSSKAGSGKEKVVVDLTDMSTTLNDLGRPSQPSESSFSYDPAPTKQQKLQLFREVQNANGILYGGFSFTKANIEALITEFRRTNVVRLGEYAVAMQLDQHPDALKKQIMASVSKYIAETAKAEGVSVGKIIFKGSGSSSLLDNYLKVIGAQVAKNQEPDTAQLVGKPATRLVGVSSGLTVTPVE